MQIRSCLVSVLALALFALPLGACGGSGSDADTTEPTADVVADGGADVAAPDDAKTEDATGDEDVPSSPDGTADDTADEPDETEPPDVVEEVAEEIVEDLGPNDLKWVKGKVVDGDGNPIPDLFVQPCTYYSDGSELCHKAISDEKGEWLLTFTPAKTDLVGLHVRIVDDYHTPWACYWDWEEAPFADNTIDIADPYVLYELPDETAVVPANVDEPVTVAADGATFTVQPEEWFPGVWEDTVIRGMRFPLEETVPCFLPPDNLPDELYSFTPDWLTFSTPGGVEIRFENTKELAAGAKVSLFVLGQVDTKITPLEGDPVALHTGQWFEFGTGSVSGDGTEIISDPGTGIPGIGWIGWQAQ